MLVRAGASNLYIVDMINFSIQEKVVGFWLHEGNPTKPVAATATLDSDIIVGISLVQDKKYAFHYYNKNMASENKTKTQTVSSVVPQSSFCLD